MTGPRVIRNPTRAVGGTLTLCAFAILFVALAATSRGQPDSGVIYGIFSVFFLAVGVSVGFDKLIVDGDTMTVVDRFKRTTFNINDVESVNTRPSTSPIFTGGGIVELALRGTRPVRLRGTATFSTAKLNELRATVATELRCPTA